MFDLIFGNSLIVIAVLFTVLPLVAAVTIAVYPSLKRYLARRRSQQKARQKRLRLPDDLVPAHALLDEESDEPTSVEDEAKSQVKLSEAASSQQVQTTGSSEKAARSDDVTNKTETENSSQDEKQVDSAVQDILSSVFDDNEAVVQYDVLLRDTKDVDINQLASLGQQLTDQLGSKQ